MTRRFYNNNNNNNNNSSINRNKIKQAHHNHLEREKIYETREYFFCFFLSKFISLNTTTWETKPNKSCVSTLSRTK